MQLFYNSIEFGSKEFVHKNKTHGEKIKIKNLVGQLFFNNIDFGATLNLLHLFDSCPGLYIITKC
jgi:hypothetical protein